MNKCKKCGSIDIAVFYHSCWGDCDYGDKHKRQEEHLHKNCRKCGYDWVEDCLDKLPDKK